MHTYPGRKDNNRPSQPARQALIVTLTDPPKPHESKGLKGERSPTHPAIVTIARHASQNHSVRVYKRFSAATSR